MSSVSGAGLAQIPRNSHFRCIPGMGGRDTTAVSNAVFTFTATSGVAPLLTNPAGAATGSFSLAPWLSTAGPLGLMSSGQGLFKDLGETIVSAGRTFRRVQLLNFNTTTEQQGGTYTGVDSDANAGYIEVGFRGTGAVGPFVRGY
jgi:hypothetical protein